MLQKRFEAEQLAGRTLLRLPMFDERVPDVTPFRRRLNVVLVGLLSLFVIFGASEMVLNPPPGQALTDVVFDFGFMSLISIWWTLRVVTLFWWRTGIRFGERGILWDRTVLLWDHIVSCKWDRVAPTILEINGIDQHNSEMNLKVSVPGISRDEVESLIKSKVVQNSAAAIMAPMNELGGLPLSVAAQDPRFPKYVRFIVLFILAMIAVHFLFGAGVTGIREFDRSILWGFILSGIVGSLWRRPHAAQVVLSFGASHYEKKMAAGTSRSGSGKRRLLDWLHVWLNV